MRILWIAALSGLICFCALAALFVSCNGSGESCTAGPQCGHWSVLRVCDLLGAPVSMPQVVALLPYRKDGHSMLELAEVLGQIGFDTEGRQETWERLGKGTLPCIAQLRNPDHFVVLYRVDENRVDLFDGGGRRMTQCAKRFQNRWSGKILCVKRKPNVKALPAFASKPTDSDPCIQFDRLLVDRGDIAAKGEPIRFVYPFRNLGGADLLVKRVRTSCGCVDSLKPKEPIPPGGEGTIELSYHVESEGGAFTQTALVETNDLRFPVIQLTAFGDTYVEVQVKPATLVLGAIVAGQTHTAVCFVNYSGSGEGFHIEKVTSTLDGTASKHYSIQDAEFARRWWPEGTDEPRTSRATYVVELTITPPLKSSGQIEGTVHIHTNVEGFDRITVPVTGQIVPPVGIYPGILNFGEVLPTAKVRQVVTLSPRVDEAYRIVAVEPNHTELHCSFSTSTTSGNTEIQLATTGSFAARLAGKSLQVRIELVESRKEILLPLPVYAWKLKSE